MKIFAYLPILYCKGIKSLLPGKPIPNHGKGEISMAEKPLGRQTVRFSRPPTICTGAAIGGAAESAGPLGPYFDWCSPDLYFGEKTWEQGESAMVGQCFQLACRKAKLAPEDLQYILAGDLLNQCIGSAFGLKDSGIPYFGLYGACSTMAEGLSLGAMLLDGGYADALCAATCSHFCSSERQFRLPLEYGGQRPPTTQWTATAAGAAILTAAGSGPYLTHVTTGRIRDLGITDANNMGAAMAPAAYDTLRAHFADTGRSPDYYDAIFTGDLGRLGHQIVAEQFLQDGVDLSGRYFDCGLLLFDQKRQDVHAGGSGCGCAAAALCGYILAMLRKGAWHRVLFSATGALLSATSASQGATIPGICHAVAIETEVE